MFVTVQLGGRDFEMLLDTGCAVTAVSHAPETEDWPVRGAGESSGAFASQGFELVEVPHFQCGPLVAGPIELRRKRSQGQPRVRHFLGVDRFQGSRLEWCFKDHKLRLHSPESWPKSLTWWPLRAGGRGIPHVDIDCGEAALAVWDSGASVSCFDKAFVERHPDCFVFDGLDTGEDSTGETMETPMYRVQGLRCGGLVFPPHRVASFDFSHIHSKVEHAFQAILGITTMTLATWYFDFPGQSWSVSRETLEESGQLS